LTVGIVLLAMIALFVGLRLYSVLGQRTGHEQQPVTRPETAKAAPLAPPKTEEASPAGAEPSGYVFEPEAAGGIRAIVSAESNFDVARFLEGAQAAYRMVLEAFWSGDRQTLSTLVSPDVRAAFEAAIDERERAGHKLENRLVAIERASIEDARVQGRVAAITRDANGEMIAGSMTDAIPTHDVWTFRRTLRSNDPNWVLVETDAVE
jgi:predicted lipid-binding transport protein (Tim44 family)